MPVQPIYEDPALSDLDRIVLGQGLLFTRETALPAAVVARADDQALYLRLDKAAVDAWVRLAEGQVVWTRDGWRLGAVRRRLLDVLEVEGEPPTQRVRVPLAAVARLDDDRVVLSVDAAETAGWGVLLDGDEPPKQTVPML